MSAAALLRKELCEYDLEAKVLYEIFFDSHDPKLPRSLFDQAAWVAWKQIAGAGLWGIRERIEILGLPTEVSGRLLFSPIARSFFPRETLRFVHVQNST